MVRVRVGLGDGGGTRQDKHRHETTREDKATFGKVGQDKEREDTARQVTTRQDKHRPATKREDKAT